MLHDPCRLGVPEDQSGEEIISGYLAPTSCGAHMWAKVPPNPYHLRGSPPSSTGRNEKWLPNPRCLGGPHVAMWPHDPHCLGEPPPPQKKQGWKSKLGWKSKWLHVLAVFLRCVSYARLLNIKRHLAAGGRT